MITYQSRQPIRTFKFEAQMPEHPNVEITLGAEDGDSTFTKIRFYNNDNNFEYESNKSHMTVASLGEWERQGFFNALSFTLDILRLYGNVKG